MRLSIRGRSTIADRRIAAVQPGYPGQIDRKVAHDPLDDVGAEAVFLGECVALGGGEPVLGDAREIVARRNGVLHESLRHAADGAGAETDQRVGGIVGVALEVALQPAFLSRDGQTVAGKGEMIEADADVAGVQQGFRDGFGLQVPLDAVGQGVFGDLALMLLERGNVGVAEHRKAVRPQLDAFGDGVETRVPPFAAGARRAGRN